MADTATSFIGTIDEDKVLAIAPRVSNLTARDATASDVASGPTVAPPRRSLGITVLAVLAVVYTLYFGHAFFVPIIFAMQLNFLLSPAIRWARRRLGIPAGISSALLILTLAGGIGLGVYELAGPARAWLVSAPSTLSRAGAKLHTVLKPMEQMSRTAEQMEKASNVTGRPRAARWWWRGQVSAHAFWVPRRASLAQCSKCWYCSFFSCLRAISFSRR